MYFKYLQADYKQLVLHLKKEEELFKRVNDSKVQINITKLEDLNIC